MSERDELVTLLNEWLDDEAPLNRRQYVPVADSILATGYRKRREITTVEELESLRPETVIRDWGGNIYERFDSDLWFETGAVDPDRPELPATLLYRGGEDQ